MEHIDRQAEFHRVDRAVGVPHVVRYDLQHPCTAEAFQGFGVFMLIPYLGQMQRVAHVILHLVWKRPEILVAGTNSFDGFEYAVRHCQNMAELP